MDISLFKIKGTYIFIGNSFEIYDVYERFKLKYFLLRV